MAGKKRNVRSAQKFSCSTQQTVANHSPLIRHVLIDSTPRYPSRDARCAKIFPLCVTQLRARLRSKLMLTALYFHSRVALSDASRFRNKALCHRSFFNLFDARGAQRNVSQKIFPCTRHDRLLRAID
jgi:hypothetical protein